ncbi:C40 family peptidase [Streptomyces sp. NPDC087903]|uniref:C40 family peptidase n=1 Tax=Streptomyces sp. NPDC087903 TaxID=3365819 RepID=UPI00382CB086
MAPERTSRPRGLSLPGPRGSALATAALTSVALFTQTADAVPLSGEDTPSRDEVQQRVNTLYDQAETATGNYNATRAMTTGTRRRAEPRRTDASPDNVTRQWFDAARTRVGPTVPAVLPRDRTPEAAPTARPAERRSAAPELTAGPPPAAAPELPAGPAARPVLELTAGPAPAALPALTAGPAPALPALPGPRQEAVAAQPAPAAEAQRSSLRSSKEQNRRKLAAARELMARYTVQQRTPVAAIEAPPVQESWLTFPDLPAVPAVAITEPARPTVEEVAWQQQPVPGPDLIASTPSVLDTGLPAAAVAPVVPQDQGNGGKAVRAMEFARSQIGRPCVWGATGPESYDCASLTQAAWRAAGVALPRNAPDQASAGTVIPLGDVRPGDLIFFYDDLSHLGLYTGNGMMIHAPGPGTYIREESVYFAGESAIRGAVRLA